MSHFSPAPVAHDGLSGLAVSRLPQWTPFVSRKFPRPRPRLLRPSAERTSSARQSRPCSAPMTRCCSSWRTTRGAGARRTGARAAADRRGDGRPRRARFAQAVDRGPRPSRSESRARGRRLGRSRGRPLGARFPPGTRADSAARPRAPLLARLVRRTGNCRRPAERSGRDAWADSRRQPRRWVRRRAADVRFAVAEGARPNRDPRPRRPASPAARRDHGRRCNRNGNRTAKWRGAPERDPRFP